MKNLSLPPVAIHALLTLIGIWVGDYLNDYAWGAGLAVLLNGLASGVKLYMEKAATPPPTPSPASAHRGGTVLIPPPERNKVTRWLFG